MSYRNLEDQILFALLEEIIDIEDAIILASELPKPTEIFYFRLDIDSFTEQSCIKLFRFSQTEIRMLVDGLSIPNKIKVQEGYVCNAIEGLCIVLRRLCYPGRWRDLETIFGRSQSSLCTIFLHLADFLTERHQNILNLDTNRIANNLALYSNAVHEAGAPLENCWGFIDGTVRPVARPTKGQKIFYNGHKRIHAIKYQAIMCPDGIIAHCSKAMEGCRHDSAILIHSNIEETIHGDQRFNGYLLYGDPAYRQDLDFVIGPYRGVITQEQQDFNAAMSKHRVCVEWGFGIVLNNWTFMEHKKPLKVLGTPVGLFYQVAVLLTNCLTCLKGSNQISSHFNLNPPTLNEYLNNE